ncbi:MAG: nucleoside-diphosphate kinase [Deltaproteobacteria bacterium]|nr:nucleoside-diphosphate kinase [Deltaproteobacteria bacterium]
MAVERTLAIVKPNAVARNLTGAVVRQIEEGGLRVLAMRMFRLTEVQARAFYDVHRARPFFDPLVQFMTSGPVVVLALEGEDAVRRWRELMGATDPAQAAPGTIRALYGENVQRNAVHGSDGPDTAGRELAFFFPGCDLP